jgi:hypothetical protein
MVLPSLADDLEDKNKKAQQIPGFQVYFEYFACFLH